MREITTGDFMHVHGGLAAGVDYTVRISVRLTEAVDADILARALEKTRRRYPYLCVRLRKGKHAYFYEENFRPVPLLRTEGRIRLNTAETDHHVWAVCWQEDRIHLDIYHGITDGTGMYALLATLLYYYCAERYGVTDHTGVRTLEDPILPEETQDPQDTLVPPPCLRFPPTELRPAFTLETDGMLTPSEPTLWDIELPEDEFIRFTSANDASPGTMISLLLARAVDSLYPDREKDIVSAYVVNARPMLGAEQTYHNCLTMALFPYSDRVRAMPFSRQCTVYRGMTFVQSDADRVRESMAANAALIREAAGAQTGADEKKAAFGPAFRGGEGFVTFLVSYTGKWRHPVLGRYIREFWAHPPNTFGLMTEIGAVNGKIFLSVQQRFREDAVREAFLRQLDEHGIRYELRRVLGSDVAFFPDGSE